ncbi:Acetyltransferase [Pseudooceanicola batsensis HTCC2597]|uniref:Acetyltransferase n=1 Tax=Pseudooceanicola batsensis (strain ATCC BAA-863 / DSM 15984 / KCTC 12145 / HTCC2597) TaxID=252305 RepID=A3TTX2_PSEBH|nr:GNAT family protein [Pseudooceanicola batsensis]EAQ05099.1 Acetyltransferase [Pseudooceanicola batsensis HTCC2597]
MTEDRPVGPLIPGWRAPPAPPADLLLEGRHVRLEPLRADRHAALLFREIEGEDWLWDYMSVGPFNSAAQFHRFVQGTEAGTDPLFLAIRPRAEDRVVGFAAFLRVTPAAGSIEVGFILMSPALQRTPAATEAMFLMMEWAFEAGYRRYEWKCDALNRPSRRAAQRLGFSYEGVFRQAAVVKGRNRDTAWFAVIDKDWAALREAFEFWLSPANFSDDGRQRERLGDLTRLVRVSSDPEA